MVSQTPFWTGLQLQGHGDMQRFDSSSVADWPGGNAFPGMWIWEIVGADRPPQHTKCLDALRQVWGHGESDWCLDWTSTPGAWRHAEVDVFSVADWPGGNALPGILMRRQLWATDDHFPTRLLCCLLG